MKRYIAVLLSVAAMGFSLSARAALVYDGWDTGPGGLSTPYPAVNPTVFAGLIELTGGNSGSILAMSNDPNPVSHVGESWAMTYYSYAEVQAGAPVRFTSAQYARAAYQLNGLFDPIMLSHFSLSLRQVAEMSGNDTLASLNTQVWDIMASTSCPSNVFGNCSNVDTFDWSTLMAVASGGPGRDEYLIPLASQGLTLGSGTVSIGPVVPVPPAFWLLGSGLLGLVGVARKRSRGVTPLS